MNTGYAMTANQHVHALLALNEQRFRAVFNATFQFILILDPSGVILEANEAVCQRSGMAAANLKGIAFWEGNWWVSCNDRVRARDWVHVAAAGQAVREELDVLDKDGKIVRIDLSIKPVRNEQGQVVLLIPEASDVTELRSQHQALLQAEKRFSLTQQNSPFGVAIIGPDYHFLSVNQSWCRLFGYEEERELIGKTFGDLAHPDDLGPGGYLQGLIDGHCDHFTLNRRCMHKNGSALLVQLDVSVLRSPTGTPIHFIAQVQDLSQQQRYESSVSEALRMNERLEHQANHDLLTGLPNRQAFVQVINEAIRLAPLRQHPGWLIYLDVDHFKIVNDSSGHAAGDKLIRELAGLFRTHVRSDDFIARLGGDEFAIVLQDCPQQAAERVAENLIERLRDYRLEYRNKTFAVGLSAGIAIIDGSIQDHSMILAQADTACYAAKDKGRGRWQVYQADSQEIVLAHQQMDVARRLHRALEEDGFELYLQKIVNDAGETTGFEALLRMKGENGEIISPTLFMPVAKRMGLSSRIDKWVISHIFNHLRAGLQSAENVYISINLSAKSVSDPQFLNWLLPQLEQHGLPGRQLCFEITETEQLQSTPAEARLIDTLRTRGHKIWLDDFGTGYNSFELLKRLTVDGLKIDSSVTRDVLDDPIDRALVEAAVSISRALKLEMVAEGVENETLWHALVDMGIPKLQGYLFHHAEQAQQVLPNPP